jgi:hypothetical protein
MLSIRSVAPVAEQQHLVAGPESVNQHLAYAGNRRHCFFAAKQALLSAD